MIKERRTLPQQQTDQNYRTLVENIKDYAIFMLDKDGCITSWDQGAQKLFGYKRGEIVGKSYSILFTTENKKRKRPQLDMATAISEGRVLNEQQYTRKNRTKFWGNGVLTSSKDKIGTHQGFSKIIRDVTEQTDLHKTAVHNSMHDFLTGLPNRSFFEEQFIDSISEMENEYSILLAVFYMDFDDFKTVNDQKGHEIGDLVLIEIAHRLNQNIRVTDIVARFGGDEFVILAKGFKTESQIARFAQKIILAFRKPIIIKKHIVKTSISIGISQYPKDGKKPSKLLRFADLALYESKKRGGNQYQFYT